MLSVSGKVYSRILTERRLEIIVEKVSEEQGSFRKRRGCLDQIFALNMVVEKHLRKDRKFYAAVMDLGRSYESSGTEAMGQSENLWLRRAATGRNKDFMYEQVHM